MNGIWHTTWNLWTGVLLVKVIIEVIASHYAVFYFFVAWHYRVPHTGGRRANGPARVAVGYLCCEDLDVEALESIVKHCAGPTTTFFVHDDSASPESKADVDRTAKRLKAEYGCEIRVLRRRARTGGKPGAVNNLVESIGPEWEYLLICDSDSFIYGRDALPRALRYFEDESVAVVQFRTIGHVGKGDSDGYVRLSESVTFYDAFVYFSERFGWSPFLGHNALLRLDVFAEVGGFRPGQLADDIDYSVRLRMRGYRVRYAREVVAGERHPRTYLALRRRTFKWSYGCSQVLAGSGWRILLCRRIPVSEKMTFFLTVGYYHFQILLLVYLTIFYLLFPFVTPTMGGAFNLIFSAGTILLLTFLPSLSYFTRKQRVSHWLPTAAVWGFVYGSQDFVMIRAVLRGLVRKRVEWIPTNLETQRGSLLLFLPELVFGCLIVAVALVKQPLLLALPTTILFAGKNLVAPFLQRAVFA